MAHGQSADSLQKILDDFSRDKSSQLEIDNQMVAFGKLMHKMRLIKDSRRTNHTGDDEIKVTRSISAIYTYFGQFVDHDLILSDDSCNQNGTSNCLRINELKAYRSKMQSYSLSLDPLYATEPDYDAKGKMFFKSSTNPFTTSGNAIDLPRCNQKKIAKVSDVRSDDNWMLSQIHLLFIRLHNKLCDYIAKFYKDELEEAEIFAKAKEMNIQIYRDIVKSDYLKTLLVKEAYNLFFSTATQPNLPDLFKSDELKQNFEKSVFRVGHAMVADEYVIQQTAFDRKILKLTNLFDFNMNRGPNNFKVASKEDRVDWLLFVHPEKTNNKASIVFPSIHFHIVDEKCKFELLAYRNLVRNLEIPSYNDVAQSVCTLAASNLSQKQSKNLKKLIDSIKVNFNNPNLSNKLTGDFLQFNSTEFKHYVKELEQQDRQHVKEYVENLFENCPMWYGILCESFQHNYITKSKHTQKSILGPVGSFIAGDIFKKALHPEMPTKTKQSQITTPKINSLKKLVLYLE